MGDVDEAQEALSGAMLRAWEGSEGQMHRIGNLRAWLTTITKHHCIDLLRARNRSLVHLADPETLAALADADGLGPDSDLEGLYIRAEQFEAVLHQIDGLPERLRAVLEMRAYLGMEYGEIAGILQISQDTARRRVHEARKLLKDALLFEPAPRKRTWPDLPDDGGFRGHDNRSSPSGDALPLPAPEHPALHAVCVESPHHDSLLILFRPAQHARIAQRTTSLIRHLQSHPESWKKRLELGEILLLQGHIAAAATIWQEVLAVKPHLFDLRVRLMGIRLLHADWAPEALTTLETPSFISPSQSLLLEGLRLMAEGDLQQACLVLQEATVRMPDHVAAMHAYLLALWRAGADLQVESSALQWLRSHPFDRAVHFLRGMLPRDPMEQIVLFSDSSRMFPLDSLAKAQWLRSMLTAGQNPVLAELPAQLPACLRQDLEWMSLLRSEGPDAVAAVLAQWQVEGKSLPPNWRAWHAQGPNTAVPAPTWHSWQLGLLI
jgi:RNA polymerase sigma-70 factor (ECF subfamily)